MNNRDVEALENLMILKVIISNYIEFLKSFDKEQAEKIKEMTNKSLTSITEAVALLIKYENVLNWSRLTKAQDFDDNRLYKFEDESYFMRAAIKLGKLEDIYEEANKDEATGV